MAYIKNKVLYIQSDEGSVIPFCTIKKEIFLTQDIISQEVFNFSGDYFNAVTSPLSKKVIRVFLLNGDESIQGDISEFVADDWNLSEKCEDGCKYSGNICLVNNNGDFSPSPVKSRIWKGTKFKIHVGLCYDESVYWRDWGIFVSGNPTVDNEKHTVNLPLYDKFALLDGKIGGKRANSFKIPASTLIKDAISLCLTEDKGNGTSYDEKPLMFLSSASSQKTPYTIMKDPNTTIGEIILELATMINGNVYYNSDGRLMVVDGVTTNDDLLGKPLIWTYTAEQHSPLSFSIDFDKLVNEIIVSGSIENGKQYTAKITNQSASSQMNIYITEPNPLYIEDSNIIGDANCEVRAKYELIKQGRLGVQIDFTSIFIPHLTCDELVVFLDKDTIFSDNKYVLNSVSINNSAGMSVSVSSVNEVIF